MRICRWIHMLALSLVLTACAGGTAADSSPAPQEAPSQIPSAISEPQPTNTGMPPTEVPTALPMGEALFRTEMRLGFATHACSYCHAPNEVEVFAPSMPNIAANAAIRVEGMNAEDYIRQSIVDPGAFIAGEFAYPMPEGYGDLLTEAQIDSLVDYILE